jgi:sodium/hydrogen exchanger-like protein 6/7
VSPHFPPRVVQREPRLHFRRTLSQFHGEDISIYSFFHGTGIFLFTFGISLALGVSFGLSMSLILKYSSLHAFPAIESCLVALIAYTCYFLSNGLSMSGIVSLLFCGITLKHYAYHTMSKRTQRTTKYLFAILAQLSENFIFIYLGMSLFTSPPSGEKVTSYVKPLFIAITTVAVIFTRYAAVFPLSELINFFHRHARGQRAEELPHSYQMMLFWAGLRGAVGVALAAGFKGESSQTLRMTVLVVVVLTVVMFGGTTLRMLEVTGIKTGVEDEAASSDDEDAPLPSARNGSIWRTPPPGRSPFGRGFGGMDEEDGSALASQPEFPRDPGRVGTHYASQMYNHHGLQAPPGTNITNNVFSAASSSDSGSDEGEVLPMAPTAHSHSRQASGQRSGSQPATPTSPGDDGKWFQALDERYLLPLFSNATASRTFHARRARRAASNPEGGSQSVGGTPMESDEEDGGDEVDLTAPSNAHRREASRTSPTERTQTPVEQSRLERGLSSPMLRGPRESVQESPQR